ncbi:MAG: response regulator [Terracidiphilus sp.]
MDDKILFVDDEPAVLDGYRRMLRKEFEVDTAVGGEKGLATIHDHGPYAIVISDMRMPGMNGAQFLAQVRENAPDTVRMLLTGYTDLSAAIDAVNEGNIFRFLTKPCSKESLIEAINLGMAEYRAILTEKELIKKAQAVEAFRPELIPADNCPWDNFQGPTGLPGPSQAKGHLDPLFGVDPQGYVILFRFTLLETIEQRYGEDTARDYLNEAAQFLIQALRSEDRLFHWGRYVLMAVIRRQISAAATRMAIARLTAASRDQVLNVDGRSIIVACAITFDLLPVSQFANIESMLAAFDANMTVKA